MSGGVHTLNLQQLDPETGHHEPWSLQNAPEGEVVKASLPSTPSTRTLLNQPSTNFTPPSSDEKEKPEKQLEEKPKPAAKPPPKKASKWIRWQLWFNTYRYDLLKCDVINLNINDIFRKLFTFTFTFNMIGLVIAASGHFPYATRYAGSIAMGNFNFSVMMRNEVFGRFLYLFVNTLFAKVCQTHYPGALQKD